ncbi:PREDICTED: F-box/FBD/LRR-repeat protein At3g14710-like [Camelina sativa]|uniref:F-box/FBD/LRR-repeat protein At3g14710-like n=1 Tax=Camelina sativa TaxID=90675 RepID=A0ABM0W402_CAMSA|nr:PREDICTED: F-box/FBD/LRR-repeat protein At3g14710-like [Camelina sativa]
MHPETKQACLVKVPSSKKARLCSDQNFEDKFSSLHESIVSRILSHLLTVEAVSTSVLSKSWRNMWTSITELQFDDKIHRDPTDSRFTDFVDRVIGNIGSHPINSFYLRSVNSYDEAFLISWLSEVLKRNLQRLVIICHELDSVNFSPLFPSFGSLVELRLRTKSILDISAPALLPNLKFLSLEDARIFNLSSVSTNLVLNFPVLETFEASYCRCFRTDTVILDSPLLRIFEMFKCTSVHVPNASQVCKIRVLASNLEKITFSGNDSRKILLSFPPSLPEAYLALRRSHWSKKFLSSFTCVKSLGLELSKDFHVLKVPKFRQLVYLHLIYDMTRYFTLTQFLEAAPILEMLSIRDLTSPRSSPTEKLLKELRSEESPDCIRTMLKVLQIRNFKPNRLQTSVLRCVMENAGILGSVILSSPNPITEEAKAQILSYPKASPHASVFFE